MNYIYLADINSISNLQDKSIKHLIRKTSLRNQYKLEKANCFTCLNNKKLSLLRVLTVPSRVLVLNIVFEPTLSKSSLEIIYRKIDFQIGFEHIFELGQKAFKERSYILKLKSK
jgi:hypothetical protein